MPRTHSPDKAKIVAELASMRSFELSARDLYREIAGDPRVREQKIRDVFARLADEEQRHAELVQEIIDLVDGAL
jgi:rubrerythrin